MKDARKGLCANHVSSMANFLKVNTALVFYSNLNMHFSFYCSLFVVPEELICVLNCMFVFEQGLKYYTARCRHCWIVAIHIIPANTACKQTPGWCMHKPTESDNDSC